MIGTDRSADHVLGFCFERVTHASGDHAPGGWSYLLNSFVISSIPLTVSGNMRFSINWRMMVTELV